MANLSRKSNFASVRSRVLHWAVFCALGVSAYAGATSDSFPLVRDQRHAKLEIFFQSFGCPAPYHVKEYLGAADTYAIDYRLLPAISVLESTCGIYQRQNNRWGWDSARKGFSSFRAGLEYIAHQLANGRYYRNKTLGEKVRTYNPSPLYARQLETLMRKIDATAPSLSYSAVSLTGPGVTSKENE